jgi:hypothetical protein
MKEREAWAAIRLGDGTEVDWLLASQDLIDALVEAEPVAELAVKWGLPRGTLANWDAGRRHPTAAQWLDLCRERGIDVAQAFRRFWPRADVGEEVWAESTELALQRWLALLKGRMSIRELAERGGFTRKTVASWLSGRCCPRLPQFLIVVQLLTGAVERLAEALSPGGVYALELRKPLLQPASITLARWLDRRRRRSDPRPRWGPRRFW